MVIRMVSVKRVAYIRRVPMKTIPVARDGAGEGAKMARLRAHENRYAPKVRRVRGLLRLFRDAGGWLRLFRDAVLYVCDGVTNGVSKARYVYTCSRKSKKR